MVKMLGKLLVKLIPYLHLQSVKTLHSGVKSPKMLCPEIMHFPKPAGTTSILNQNISLFKPIMGESNFF